MRIQTYNHTTRGSALLISLVILILVTLLTTVFLEVIWTSSKNVQGIEASNASYYRAIWVVEQQLIDPNVSKKTPWNIASLTEGSVWSGTWRSLTVQTGSSIMPAAWFWNSPYDDDYNIISLGAPVQIVIPPLLGTWSNVTFEFRVPNVSSTSWTGIDNAMNSSWIILWTLWYSWASIYASGETQIFKWNDVNAPMTTFSSFSGITNTGSVISVGWFYSSPEYLWNNGSNCNPYNCTLKLSMIRPVRTSWAYPRWLADWRSLPFLEYKINFNGVNVPSQFMTLDASAYAYGFQRTRRIRIPQITTNTALDFAVLQ